jgi:hypothetical protein
MADTPNLDEAIHAAKVALEATYDWDGYNVEQVARIALLGAWDKLGDLFLAELALVALDQAASDQDRCPNCGTPLHGGTTHQPTHLGVCQITPTQAGPDLDP